MLHHTTIPWLPERMRRLIFSLSCSSGKAANVPKPVSSVIASSSEITSSGQDLIALGVLVFGLRPSDSWYRVFDPHRGLTRLSEETRSPRCREHCRGCQLCHKDRCGPRPAC